MKWKLFTAMTLLLGSFAVSSCDSGKSEGSCNPGREKVNGECVCINDSNYNGVCDEDEPQEFDVFQEVKGYDTFQPKIDTLVGEDSIIVEDTIEQILDTIPIPDTIQDQELHLPDSFIGQDSYFDVNPDIPPETSPPLGEFGDFCEQNLDCYSGYCLIGTNSCTATCIEYCPGDWTCQYFDTTEGIQAFCLPSDYSDEVCDNKDNDYDGLVDEDLKQNCGNNNGWGYCSGKEICENGTWTECNALIPSKETCDNIDNNCDGATDDEIDSIVTQCDDGTQYITYCDDGEWIDYGSCD
jgi:hypothetical protein